MQVERASGADWRDPAAYSPLLAADFSLIAWEWLRRDAYYRLAAERALAGGARTGQEGNGAPEFGLVAFEDPRLPVPHARPLWRFDLHPYVLRVERSRSAFDRDAFDLAALPGAATLLVDGDGEHLLLSDGLRAIRLDGPAGAFSDGPAPLRYFIEGLASARAPLVTLRRFLALSRAGRFEHSLHRREAKALRWILMLRAHDALAVGADQRTIAQQLFSRSADQPRWRSREPDVRSRAQRLVRSARALAAGGYRSLLS